MWLNKTFKISFDLEMKKQNRNSLISNNCVFVYVVEKGINHNKVQSVLQQTKKKHAQEDNI